MERFPCRKTTWNTNGSLDKVPTSENKRILSESLAVLHPSEKILKRGKLFVLEKFWGNFVNTTFQKTTTG